MRQIAVTSTAPRSNRYSIAAINDPLGVDVGLEGLLVAHHPEAADLGRRPELPHALAHPEPGPEDGYDERSRRTDRQALRFRDGRLHIDALDAYRSGRLVSEQSDEFFRQRPEGRRRRCLVAQDRELVGDERMVGNVYSHRLNLSRLGSSFPTDSAHYSRAGQRGIGWPVPADTTR